MTKRTSASNLEDPIFAAIVEHRASVLKTNRLLEIADHDSMVHDLLRSERRAAQALVATAPTTHAGLRALDEHLREDAHRGAIHLIRHTVTTDDGTTYTISGDLDQGVNRLIAQRAAEIDGA